MSRNLQCYGQCEKPIYAAPRGLNLSTYKPTDEDIRLWQEQVVSTAETSNVITHRLITIYPCYPCMLQQYFKLPLTKMKRLLKYQKRMKQLPMTMKNRTPSWHVELTGMRGVTRILNYKRYPELLAEDLLSADWQLRELAEAYGKAQKHG